MKEYLVFRAIAYDTQKTDKDVLTYSFFNNDGEFEDERANQLHEEKIVEWIFRNQFTSLQYLIYDELNIDYKYKPFLAVRKPIVENSNDTPGDIDILFVDENRPGLSIGIQVKRVKATIDENEIAHLKTAKLKKGVNQTKKMYEQYRFHQNYLMIIIVTDGQNKKSQNHLFRSPSLTEKRQIYSFSGFGDLPEKVGIFFYEITQPTKKHLNESGILASKAIRHAKPIDQLNTTTKKIKQLNQTK